MQICVCFGCWFVVCGFLCVCFLKASKLGLFWGVFFTSSLVPTLFCTFYTQDRLKKSYFFKSLLAYSLYTLTLDCRVFC